MADLAGFNQYFPGVRIMAFDAGVSHVYMGVLEVIRFAIVLVANLSLTAIKRGCSGAVVNVDEAKPGFCAISILDLGRYLICSSDHLRL